MADKMLIKASGKATVIADDDERIIEGWVSTDDLDRYNEITDPQAFKRSKSTYMKNPVLFFAHETWRFPIGKILKMQIKEHGVWVQAKISEGADVVWGLIKEEILKTFSFGYKLLKYDDNEKTGVRTLRDIDLYEISLPPIPANPGAMIELVKSMGIEIPNLKSMHKEESMTKEELQAITDAMEAKIDAMPKAFTADEAKKALSDIHKEVEELKKKGDISPEALKELQEKSSADLMAAVKVLEKKIETTFVTPAKMVHEMAGVDQAKRLGNLEMLSNAEHFKQHIVSADYEKAAARIGLTDQKHLLKELQDASDDLLIVGACLGMTKPGPGGVGTIWDILPFGLKTYQPYKRLLDEFHKALDTATATEGTEWVPTGMSGTLLRDIELERGLVSRMQRFNLPTSPYEWPIVTSGATAYIIAEALNDSNANTFTQSTPGTSQITFTAQGMGAAVTVSGEIVEDSIIPIIPFIRQELALALSDGEETAIINGDNASTHQDTDVAALGSSDIRKIFDGLRLDALANASVAIGGTLTYALMVSILKKADKWAIKPGEAFWLASVDSYYKALALTQFTGYDAFGTAAVAQQGQLPWAIGHPMVPSAFMRNDLDPNGVNAASDNVHTALMIVNAKGYMIGDRRQSTVETDRIVLTDQTVIVAKQRLDLQKITVSGATPSAIGINITSA